RGLPLGGMRVSASGEVTRSISGLSALLPGTTAFDFTSAARVSNDTPALYLPLVWHSAQRAFKSGSTSCAKSTRWPAFARVQLARTATVRAVVNRFMMATPLAEMIREES